MVFSMEKRSKPQFNDMGLTQWYWRVLHHKNLELGENTEIGSFTVIDAFKGVKIGDDVKIGFGCTILSYSSIDNKGGKTILGKNCKIGSGSVIMPGVEIGENSIIGANSFLNKDVPPNEVWVGSPAKYLKKVDSNDL